MNTTELDVLINQLDELLTSGIEDEDDALEIAVIAGLACRLGAEPETMKDAEVWRDGVGSELLESTWRLVDFEPLVESVDDVSAGADEHAVEEALFDFDDIVAAALWCGREAMVRDVTRQVASIVRTIPDPFAPAVNIASALLALPTVGQSLEVYDYWLAVAESSAWADDGAPQSK